MFTPSACPAEVRFVREMIKALSTDIPSLTAVMPKPKDTERYPRPIGIPSFMPEMRSLLFII